MTENQPLRGRQKDALLLALAQGDETYQELAGRFEMSPQGVAQFATRPGNRATIRAIKAEGVKGLAGLWSADRRAKLAELEQLYEDASGELETLGSAVQRHRVRMGMLKMLHEMSEMSGHHTTRTVVEQQSSTYRIHGVCMNKLQTGSDEPCGHCAECLERQLMVRLVNEGRVPTEVDA